jgi:hypothetical protein
MGFNYGQMCTYCEKKARGYIEEKDMTAICKPIIQFLQGIDNVRFVKKPGTDAIVNEIIFGVEVNELVKLFSRDNSAKYV